MFVKIAHLGAYWLFVKKVALPGELRSIFLLVNFVDRMLGIFFSRITKVCSWGMQASEATAMR